MERRICQRGRTDIPVLARQGRAVGRARGIELSSSGIVIDRGRLVCSRDHSLVLGLVLILPESHFPLASLARPVWSVGSLQALKFVDMSDVDRLNLAEHVDFLRRRGQVLN